MSNPTSKSVTERLCTCGSLQDFADDPDHPITFDAETREYRFSHGRSVTVIYHCFICGGAAPKSKRPLLFAQIPRAEQDRLAKLLKDIATIDDALRIFGQPDFDGTTTTKHPEAEYEPPRIQQQRDFWYVHLSDVADICITERPDGKISWQLSAKYIGKNAKKENVPRSTKRTWWPFGTRSSRD